MKKVLVLCLVLALACMTAIPAMATSVPSKTTDDMTSVADVQSTGATPAADFSVQVTTLPAIASTIVSSMPTTNVISYFGDDVKAEVEALLPGVDTSAMTVNEIVPVAVNAYDASYGDITVTVNCATQYVSGQQVVAMVGIPSGSNVTWYAQKAEVKNGGVAVTFTQDVLTLMGSTTAIVAIMG